MTLVDADHWCDRSCRRSHPRYSARRSVSPRPGTRATAPPKLKAEVKIEVGGLLAPMIADRRDRAGAAVVAALDDANDAVKVAALDAIGRFAARRRKTAMDRFEIVTQHRGPLNDDRGTLRALATVMQPPLLR